MHASDDLFLGGFLVPGGILPLRTDSANPTIQPGAGPLGRVIFLNIVPLTIQTASLAALQASVKGVGLTLAAGTGLTQGFAPDGSGAIVYYFDVARSLSLTSVSDLSAINYLVTGYDFYGRRTTQLMAGPNNNTVTSLKAFASIQSIVPQGASASTVSAGTSDIFGIPWVVSDAGYVISAKWNNTLAQDAGTLVLADATSPATNATGDPRGTYKPSANASNGSRRLVLCIHLTGGQCGVNANVTNLLGVTPA